MEEKKEKKKLNKKPLLICLALAFVFALIGIVDINVNAAESVVNGPLIEEQYLNVEESYILDSGKTIHRKWDFGVPECRVAFLYSDCEYDDNCRGYTLYCDDALEDSVGTYYWKCLLTRTEYDENSEEIKTTTDNTAGQYCFPDDNQQSPEWYDSGSLHYDGIFYESLNIDTNVPIFTNFTALQNYLSTGAYNKDDVKVEIDYDTLPVDDGMLVPEDVKYNLVIDNNIPDNVVTRVSADVYDVLSWKNTSSEYYIQLESVPIVQFRKINMALNSYGVVHNDGLIKEFKGEWRTEVISDTITNTYKKYSNGLNIMLEDKEAYDFKAFCDETYEWNTVTEESNLVFGYRLRYVDTKNAKASAWVYLMPTEKEYGYITYVEYSDGTKTGSDGANGLVNEYDNLENVEDAVTDITTENDFKDKYDIVDGDVDTQEATNWLYSVVNFIKGTPQVVGSVLGFLPQPILYGMYVTIFLGVIASGLAIIKALF